MKEEVKDNKQEPSINVKDVGEINPETLFQQVSEDQVHKWLRELQDRSV